MLPDAARDYLPETDKLSIPALVAIFLTFLLTVLSSRFASTRGILIVTAIVSDNLA